MTYYKNLTWMTQTGTHVVMKYPDGRCQGRLKSGEQCSGKLGHSHFSHNPAPTIWKNQINQYRERNLDAPEPETFEWEESNEMYYTDNPVKGSGTGGQFNRNTDAARGCLEVIRDMAPGTKLARSRANYGYSNLVVDGTRRWAIELGLLTKEFTRTELDTDPAIEEALEVQESPVRWVKVVSRKIRREVLERDKFVCADCGITGGEFPEGYEKFNFDVDHIVPRSQGGTDTPGNGQVLCKVCHGRKTADERRDN